MSHPLWELVLLMFGACASAPEDVRAAYVDPAIYGTWSCAQIRVDQDRVVRELVALGTQQQRARSNDAAGVIFLGLPIASMTGQSVASAIARRKGEQQALDGAAIARRCADGGQEAQPAGAAAPSPYRYAVAANTNLPPEGIGGGGICPTAGTRASYTGRERGTLVSIVQQHRGASPTSPEYCRIGANAWLLGLIYVPMFNQVHFASGIQSLLPFAVNRTARFSFVGQPMETGQQYTYENTFTVTGRDAVKVAGADWDAWVIELRQVGTGANNHSSLTRFWRDVRSGLVLRIAVVYTNGSSPLSSRELTEVQLLR